MDFALAVSVTVSYKFRTSLPAVSVAVLVRFWVSFGHLLDMFTRFAQEVQQVQKKEII